MGVFSTRPQAARGEARSFVVPIGTVSDDGFMPNLGAAETSLQSIAVRSAVDLIASTVSEFPVDVYRGSGPARTQVATPSYLLDPGGDGHGLQDWIYQLVESWLLRGNAYGDILDTAPTGYVTQCSWFYPDDVRPSMGSDGRVTWVANGREIPTARFLHRRVNPVPGRVLGLSPIEFHAATIGVTLSSTRFGASWFRDSATPGGLLVNSETDIDPAVADIAKQRFLAALRGRREPVVLGRGWDYKQVQISPEESQFLETQGFTEAQCARMFGPAVAEILGYETGGSMTYANVVDRRADLLVLTVNKWVNRVERVLSAMLPRPQYARLNRDAILQATTLQRYQAYAVALDKQFRTVNEVRDDEELPPVSWGDEPNKPAPTPTTGTPTPDGGNGNPA